MYYISVVIPCYNATEWIEATLRSVVQQTVAPCEIIVVDDGSIDRSAEIVAAKFPSVRLIRIENGGPSRARNIGIEAAKGTWIQLLDADDLIHPQKLEWQTSSLANYDDSIAFVFSPWQRLYLENGQWEPRGNIESTGLYDDSYTHIFDQFTPLGSGLLRKSWLQEIGGFEVAHQPIEDVHLQLRLVHAGAKFVSVPTPSPVYYYRQLPKSFSQLNHRRFVDGCYANVKVADAFIHEHEHPTIAHRELLARHYVQVGRYYAEHDTLIFAAIVRRIEELVPGFVPASPRLLASLSKVIGYRQAEQFSVLYRKVKQALSRSAP